MKYSVSYENLNQKGISFIEVVVAIAVFSIFLFIGLSISEYLNKSSHQAKILATRDRIVRSIVTIASMPATLRNSALAAIGLTPINPALYNCVVGKTIDACQSGQEFPVALFSPLILEDNAGDYSTIVQITSPKGEVDTVAYDDNGVVCDTTESQNCALKVTTSIIPQCGPRPATYPLPANVFSPVNLLEPRDVCTVAEIIKVNFAIVLDSNVVVKDPSLYTFIQPVSGTVWVSVKKITNNSPR